MSKESSHWIRKHSGQSLAETVGVLAAVTILIPVFVDGSILLAGFQINAEACRGAARAASMSAPAAIERGTPERKVMSTLCQYSNANSYIKIIPSAISESIKGPLPQPPFGGAVRGTVTVSTTASVKMPFCTFVLQQKPVQLTASESYPFTWSMPSAASAFANVTR